MAQKFKIDLAWYYLIMIHKFIRNTFNFCRKSTLIDKYNEELT